jgi:autotransporter-associated beta strand protein
MTLGSVPAHAQTWTKGAGTTAWNTTTNWSPATIPNSATAVVNFNNTGAGAVNISASVLSQTINFGNSTGTYSITNSSNLITLSNLQAINVAAGVTTADAINLTSAATGNLIFNFFAPTITDNSTAAGNTLVIGPNTVIGSVNATAQLSIVGPGNVQFTGSCASGTNQLAQGLLKFGPGTFTFSGSGANLNGNITQSGGTLALDYSTNTATKLTANGSLILDGGVLSFTTNTSTPVTQTLTSTILNNGQTDVTATGTGTLTLAAGILSRSAYSGTADFNLAGPATFSVQATSALLGVTGAAVPWATVNGGSTWATTTGSGPYTVAPFTAYATDAYSTNLANVDVVSPPAAPQSNIHINTLRFNTGNQTLNLSGSNTLSNGGILVTPNATGGTINPTNSSDTLTTSVGELIVQQYSSAPFTINIGISTNVLTKTGPGTLVLGGADSFSGPINVCRGSLTATTLAAINSASSINFEDDRSGTALQTFTVNLANGVNGTVSLPITVAAFSPTSYGTAFSTGTSTNSRVTLGGVISSATNPAQSINLTTPIGFTGSATDTSGFNLTGTNTFTGTVYLTHGYLGVSSDASLGTSTNAVVLGVGDTVNGGFDFLSGFSTARSISISASSRLVVEGQNSAMLTGTVTSTGSGSGFQLVKGGVGTLNLSGDGTGFQGGITLSGGTLGLDYSSNTASKLAGGALTLGGGVLTVYPPGSGSVTQTIPGGTVVSAGHTDVNAAFGATAILAAGAITRTAGGTVDFTPSTSSPAFSITTTTTTTNSLLGTGPAFATVNGGTTWATVTSGAIAGLTIYGANTYTSGTNSDVTTSAAPATFTTNSLRFNNGSSLTLTGTNTLQSGGVLVTPLSTFAFLNGGTLTAPSSGELLFHVYGSSTLEVNSALVSTAGLTTTGPGTVQLGGTNTSLTGPININRGSLTVTNLAAIASASALNFNNTVTPLLSSQELAVNLGNGVNGTLGMPIVVSAFAPFGSYGTYFSAPNSNSTITLSNVISSAPGLTTPIRLTAGSDTSGFNLTGTNTFTGNISLQQGSLGINSDASLGSGANTLILETNDTTNGGLVFLNGGITVAHPIVINSPSPITVNGTDSNTIAGAISGAGGLIKSGTGTLTVTNQTGVLNGAITVNAGTLVLSNPNAPGAFLNATVNTGAVLNTAASLGTVTLNGGTLQINQVGNTVAIGPLLSNSGGLLDMTSTVNLTLHISSITVNASAT